MRSHVISLFMRSLQAKEVREMERHLSRADLSFFFDDQGRRCAALMMRPCKNGKHLRGKHMRVILQG